MKQKEKAQELISKFIKHCQECDKSEAIQCALIAVDEILNSIPCYEDYGGDGWILIDNSEYWKEVKKEIEKLCKENQ